MKYKIKKGKFSSFPPFPLLGIGKKTRLRWSIIFDNTVKYSLGNMSDIHKLCGIGYFPSHHKNSGRFGFRWREDKQQVQLLAYCYSEGVRLSSASTEKHLAFLDIGTEYILELNIFPEGYQFNILLGSADLQGYHRCLAAFFVNNLKKRKIPFISFYLRPYFEADNKQGAPHDMTFHLTKL